MTGIDIRLPPGYRAISDQLAHTDENVKCSRCPYIGLQSSFPRKTNLTYLKTCTSCALDLAKKREEKRAERDDKENQSATRKDGSRKGGHRGPAPRTHEARPTLSWTELSRLLEKHSKEAFDLDALIELPEEDESEIVVDDGAQTARNIAKQVWDWTGYRFIWKKQKKSQGSESSRTCTFFCAQNEKEVAKEKLTEDPKKRRARIKMDRFPCQGYLHVTVRDGDDTIGIRLSHHQAHCQYVDISIDEEIKGIIEEMKNSPASAIWDRILREHPSTELTRKQIYARWARLNESVWKLDADQVKSATLLLERLDGEKIEIIPVEKEVGIDAIAFSFINILREFGGQIEEIAMDSTWKTNSLGHELYGIVGEANGQAIPTSFMFMGTSEDAETGAKERTLRHLIRNVKQHCKNIMFTGSDKDTTEINGFRAEIPQAKHQLCYIHAISYIEKRLAEDRPPAAYDPRVANRSFRFIDPTWAPGVSSGWLEDGVSEEDAEMEKPVPSASEIQSEQEDEMPPTCLPPVFILKTGEVRIPVWPNPPVSTKVSLPTFCPKEFRKIILQKFRTHFHQHPEIPMGDEDGTFLSADEIHCGAVRDMYDFCFENDLAQVWAYMWNRWYTPKQWCLWARAACDAIPRIKTTMVVESLWKHLKHRDLAQFNRPRLDLVTHLVITNILPRVTRTLAYVRGIRRVGRPHEPAAWQVDIKSTWLDMGRSDEVRLTEKQLKCLRSARNTKGRAERLELLEQEETREQGTYHTNIERWTCNCPSFAPNRFLICKHLVREANKSLKNLPLNSLKFFVDLRRRHYPPFYHIPGIHDADAADSGSSAEEEEVQILTLGRGVSCPAFPLLRESDASSPAPSSEDGGEQESNSRDAGETEPARDDSSDNDNETSVTTDDRFDSETENEPSRVRFQPVRIANFKRSFDELMEIAENPIGLQPKMAARLERLLAPLESAANEIREHKRRRKNPRTWKDSTANTMFLD